jgi:hypothetical protein
MQYISEKYLKDQDTRYDLLYNACYEIYMAIYHEV